MNVAKKEVVLGTLLRHGHKCTYDDLFQEAERAHCDVLAAALLSLKRAKVVAYDGMMLLHPVHKDVVVTLLDGGADVSKVDEVCLARTAAARWCAGALAAVGRASRRRLAVSPRHQITQPAATECVVT